MIYLMSDEVSIFRSTTHLIVTCKPNYVFRKKNFSSYLIIEFIYRGISAQALFSLRALTGAKRIRGFTRMASFIRMRQSDLFEMRGRHFRRGNLWVQLYPRMKTFIHVPRRVSNHRRTTHILGCQH